MNKLNYFNFFLISLVFINSFSMEESESSSNYIEEISLMSDEDDRESGSDASQDSYTPIFRENGAPLSAVTIDDYLDKDEHKPHQSREISMLESLIAGDINHVKQIIDLGIDLNLPWNDREETFLHLAIQLIGVESCENPNKWAALNRLEGKFDEDGNGILPNNKKTQTSSYLNRCNIIQLLLNCGAEIDYIAINIANEFQNINEILFDHLMIIEAEKQPSIEKLILAIETNKTLLVKILISGGIEPTSEHVNLAKEYKSHDVEAFLLEHLDRAKEK